VAVGGFSALDNHLHLLLRLDPEVATGWSDEDVVRRWGRLFPPRDKSRVEHVEAQGQTAALEAATGGSVVGSLAAVGLEESLWLCPIEDRRQLDSCREGMMEGFSLGSYFLLVDYTGRLFRQGKAAISADLAGILT
jgi:hypothetical protein